MAMPINTRFGLTKMSRTNNPDITFAMLGIDTYKFTNYILILLLP